MIYTVIADIKNFNADKFLEKCVSGEDFFKIEKCRINPLPSSVYASPSISAELLDHIRSVSNERLRKERCGAYLLLSAVVKNMLGFVPEVKFSQNGKPFFEREWGIYFNLSHTNDLVAVSLSDEGSVGVDAEAEISPERAARLEARFFSELSINSRPLDVRYAFCKIDESGEIDLAAVEADFSSEICIHKSTVARVNYTCDFGARWTLYEASLKCNGGGFTSLPCLGMLLLETKADVLRLKTDHGEYFITTASV